ncbi:germ cell nuclear acidic protein [Spea bombifrons]|uniref:germ cell nuclear acidic protein n=1 Tax=Spea bombifrons TaxID=233779 RepID=UPI002349436A|nr:germ cell nuclear acidic protein [Spea bombifrons]
MASESLRLLDRISSRLAPKENKAQLFPRSGTQGILSPDCDGADSPLFPPCTQQLLLSDSDTESAPVEDYVSKFKNLNLKSGHTPRSTVVILDSSDDEFENFLIQLKTPKQRSCKVSNHKSGSLKDFVIDSDEEDFAPVFPRSSKGTRSKNGTKNSYEISQSPQMNRTPSTRKVSPVFISDSDDEDSVVIKSTWRDRTSEKKNLNLDKGTKQKPSDNCSGKPLSKNNKENRLEQRNDSPLGGDVFETRDVHVSKPTISTSSDDEFDSLMERIKNRTKNQTPCSTASKFVLPKMALTEPTKVPCFDLTNTKEKGRSQKSKSQNDSSSSPYFLPEKSDKGGRSVQHAEKPHCDSGKVRCKVIDCFLEDLSNPKSVYVKCFKQKKEELTARLYSLYNRTIFDQKLPESMEIIWNKKMRKTAGYCVTGQKKVPHLQRYARIELSEKVCDSADRLRDTLIHEICHAATWLINGVRDGHGQFWRFYARKATLIHPELPMVTRCHSYEINYKYTYECSRCKNTLGRHSKSLDTEKFVCALCKGKLVLVGSTRKDGSPSSNQLTPFAKYVKENYGSAKKGMTGMSHAEVMRKLSSDFSTKARITNGI